MRILFKAILGIIGIFAAAGVAVGVALAVYSVSLLPELPSTESIREIQLSEPLRIYTADEKLIGVYGSERRVPVNIQDVPERLKAAVLAAEDDAFYRHPGIDIAGLARALLANLRSGEHGQGASTITMQVARNYFLSRKKTYTRKLKEILLSFRLENELSKDQILELYLNKIFLGHRAYGFAAAAQVYYGRPLAELTLAETAMLAGLPKAPSSSNPVSNPKNARDRRTYVLRRMHELEYINNSEFETALNAPLTAKLHVAEVDVKAPYVTELARQYMVDHYGDDVYERGLDVYVTIRSDYQTSADKALRKGLFAYDQRHGFRRPSKSVDLSTSSQTDQDKVIQATPSAAGLTTAIIIAVSTKKLSAYLGQGQSIEFQRDGTWSDAKVKPGDVIYLESYRKDQQAAWRLSQLPVIAGALVSLDPKSGAVLALSGGFDYYLSKYNRAVQAQRQPGSNLKPFIYSAALESGFTPASLVSGAPIVVEDALQGVWRPENYSGRFFGPTPLRKALSLSLNLVSVRLMRAMGTDYALNHLSQFGFDRDKLPNGLSLALGTASLTPVQVAAGYAALANGGYRVTPYYIDRIVDSDDVTIAQSESTTLCANCKSEQPVTELQGLSSRYAPRAVSAQNAFLTASLMQQVIRSGTGTRAKSLGRSDLSGKTGTTNSFRDAWFSGFNGDVVTSVWVGFDDSRELGRGESGAKAALPIWIDYMKVALKDKPEKPPRRPDGIVALWVDRESGEQTHENDPNGWQEYFIAGTEPQTRLGNALDNTGGGTPATSQDSVNENLF